MKFKGFWLVNLLTQNRYLTFHIASISILLTGGFILGTANELGAMAAIFVPLGIYICFLGLSLEALFFLRLMALRLWVAYNKARAARRTRERGGIPEVTGFPF